MSGCTAFADKAALAEHAAAQWLERLAKRDAGRPFTVALSGGRTPRLLYESVVELARPSGGTVWQTEDVGRRAIHGHHQCLLRGINLSTKIKQCG